MRNEYILNNLKQEKGIPSDEKGLFLEKIKLKNGCIFFCYSSSSDNENDAKNLELLHKKITAELKLEVSVVSLGFADYYQKKLFPFINEFERLLRKLLIVAASMKKQKGSKELVSFELVHLEKMDLSQLYGMLFYDNKFTKHAVTIFNEYNRTILTKEELISKLSAIEWNPYWERLFPSSVLPDLREKFRLIQKCRNDVMHAHTITKSDYDESRDVLQKINEDIRSEINYLLRPKTENTSVRFVVPSDFAKTLGSAIMDSKLIHDLSSQVNQYLNMIEPQVSEYMKNVGIAIPKELQDYVNSQAFRKICENAEQVKKLLDTPRMKEISEINKRATRFVNNISHKQS